MTKVETCLCWQSFYDNWFLLFSLSTPWQKFNSTIWPLYSCNFDFMIFLYWHILKLLQSFSFPNQLLLVSNECNLSKLWLCKWLLFWVFFSALWDSRMLYVQSIGCAFVSVIGEVKVIERYQESDLEPIGKSLIMEDLNCINPEFIFQGTR